MHNIATHKALIRAFNERDWDMVTHLLHPDVTYADQARGSTAKGAQETLAQMQEWVTAFSDARAEQIRYINGGDTTIALFQGCGINDGPLGDGRPATHKRVDVPFCEVLHYDDLGKIIDGAVYYDALTQRIQLGLAEP
ncbi:ester cyclase [Streptomyces sp. A3M-1-3]|uniref:ester cyclase n=1 Tax=Streptomyces sp. A3M-1-3 TaxID=2962044 RepID=UPI0020B8C36B|nr:ester cyclase [Streptomyces sp. A3M-1-3]MCP3816827.1 ester cyclase [Streptomyces sp. A3M-1-3]